MIGLLLRLSESTILELRLQNYSEVLGAEWKRIEMKYLRMP